MEPNCDSKSRKKCVSIKKYKVVRAVAALLCIMMLAITIVPTITTYAAEDQDDSYDLEAVANTLGTIMSIGSTPVSDSDLENNKVSGVVVLNGANAGNAGLVLAYTSKPTSLGQWLASQVSASSMRYDYESLLNVPIDESGTTTQAAYQYAVYGRALQQLGLDKTVVPAQQRGILRVLAGGIMMVAYVIAYAVNGLFSVVISILQALNPFTWLEYVSKSYTADLGAQYSTNFGGTGAWHTLMRYIASIYCTMCNLSWAFIIPMSIGLYLANMFLFRKTAGGKRLLKRIIFIAIGVPLVGGTYTSFLNEMKTTFSSSSSYADNIVCSTFVDFEGWAANTHLAMPISASATSSSTIFIKKFEVEVPVKDSEGERDAVVESSISIGGEVTDETRYNIKKICSVINYWASGNSFNSTSTAIEGFSFTNNTNIDVDAETTETEVSESDISDNLQLGEDFDISTSTPSKKAKYVINLLWRYMYGDVYSAEQYASSIQSRMSALARSSDDYEKQIVIMMKALSRYTNLPTYEEGESWWGKLASVFTSDSNKVNWEEKVNSDKKEDIAKYATSKTDRENGLFGYTSIFNDGGLNCEVDGNIYSYSSKYVYSPYLKYGSGGWRDTNSTKSGLSTASMYAYLNNDFTSTGVITYGGGSAITNGLTKASHYSVNIIGNGFMSFIYWFDAVVVMVCIALIGILYAIGMLIGTLKYTLKTIMAMPMAVAGSMRYIAKFVGMVCAMMANVLVTAIMYGVVVEVILAIVNILESSPLILTLAAGIGIYAIIIMSTTMSVIVVIWLTGILLRIRSSAVNSVTEWITQVVGKFFEADGHADPSKSKGNIGQKVASGLATGAALAGGHGMLKAASALGGALSGKDDSGSGDGSGGGDDGGGRNDSVGGGIEKEVSQDHNNSHDGKSENTKGGQSRSESEIKDTKKDTENNNVDNKNNAFTNSEKENDSSTNRDAQSDNSTIVGTFSNTHDEVATNNNDESKTATNNNDESKTATNNNDESKTATNNSNESETATNNNDESNIAINNNDKESNNKEVKADNLNNNEKVSKEAALSQALSKVENQDKTGIAGLTKDTVESVDNAKNDLNKGDVKGAAKDSAGATTGIAVAALTGNPQAGNATSKVVNGAANGNVKGGIQKGIAAAGGVNGLSKNGGNANGNGGAAGSKPSMPTDGAKQLGNNSGTSEAPKKSLSSTDSAQKPASTQNSTQKPASTQNSTQKPAGSSNSNVQGNGAQKQTSTIEGNGKSTSHTGSLKAPGMTVNSNITNNISNGGTINTQNVQQGGGPSMNMANSAGRSVNNTTNVTNNNTGGNGGGTHTIQGVGGGNVVSNSAGKNVQNITNVNNVNNVQSMGTGGGNAASASGGKNVQNVTNVNNAQTVNNVNTQSSMENRSRK